jgi:hypothetical protein
MREFVEEIAIPVICELVAVVLFLGMLAVVSALASGA